MDSSPETSADLGRLTQTAMRGSYDADRLSRDYPLYFLCNRNRVFGFATVLPSSD